MSASSGYGTGGSGPVGPVVETLTGNTGGAVGPTANNINIVGVGDVVVTGNPGTSTLTISAGSAIADQFDGDTGTAVPSAGILNIVGGNSTAGKNIHTAASGNTVDVVLNDSLFFPNTNSAGTEGVLYWGGDPFIQNFGDGNTFIGANAGNLTTGGPGGLVAVGDLALHAVTDAPSCTAVGDGSGQAITSGANNSLYGAESAVYLTTGELNDCYGANVAVDSDTGEGLVSGSYNIIIGGGIEGSGVNPAGSNFTSNESSNIILRHPGIPGDQNIMRLGVDGAGNGEQNATYMAGIYNRSFASPSGVMQIDTDLKVGSSAGTNGQLLIGATGASPLWANLTSTGGSVVITNNANHINLEATGTGAGASSFPTDAGTATEAGGVLNIIGGANINTTGSGNTVTVALNEFISLPNTNTAADEGVIYLGSNTFLHNYGTANTFLGQAAGNQTLTTADATVNTGIGTDVLQNLTVGDINTAMGALSQRNISSGTTNSSLGAASLNTATVANANSCVGAGSLQFLLSGQGNCALGFNSGSNYTAAENFNIVIGNTGTNGESGAIRIGNSSNQNSAYVAGIYGASIGSTNAPVFIDNTGKLGTSAGGSSTAEAFFAYQATDQSLGAGSVNYSLGSLSALTILYDDGSNVFVGSGSGAPATFTAPTTGRYVLMTTMTAGSGQTTFWSNTITTTARTYVDFLLASNPGGLGPTFRCLQTTFLADMTAGDTATFSIQTAFLNGTTISGAAASAPVTHISGYLIE